jgi:hypothetical protein
LPRQNLEAHLKSTRCKRGCATCYKCPAGAVMGQDEVFSRHRCSQKDRNPRTPHSMPLEARISDFNFI